jgi:hypothetical protein
MVKGDQIMPSLTSYQQFGGNAPYTSTVQKALAYQGLNLPGTNAPADEAFLYGISGGAAFGYFQFVYDNVDPQINFVTRNTFQSYGWDSITSRMGLSQDVIHSTSEAKAEKKLIETLEQGLVPILWVDVFTLGYEHTEMGEGMWAMLPVVVYDYDPTLDRALLSDRSRVPLEVSAKTLLAAWGRIKKDKYKLIVLQQVEQPELTRVIPEALEDCRRLFLEKPPRGSANNFGFKAFDALIKDITGGHAKSWKKVLSTPRFLAAGLLSAFKYSLLYWKDESETGDRGLFAAFLDQGAKLLGDDSYAQAAGAYREAAKEWKKLGDLYLPDSQPVLGELKSAFRQRVHLFNAQGMEALEEIREVDLKMGQLLNQATLGPEEAGDLLGNLAGQFETIRDCEKKGLAILG